MMFNLKQIIGLNVKVKILEFVEENIGEKMQ